MTRFKKWHLTQGWAGCYKETLKVMFHNHCLTYGISSCVLIILFIEVFNDLSVSNERWPLISVYLWPGHRPRPCVHLLDVSTISPRVTLAGITRHTMCSLVEIKNPNEIYIHYMFDEDEDHEATSDRGDSIDSVDHTGDSVTINNCAVTSVSPRGPGVTSSEVGTQVDLSEDPGKRETGNKAAATKGNNINYWLSLWLQILGFHLQIRFEILATVIRAFVLVITVGLVCDCISILVIELPIRQR